MPPFIACCERQGDCEPDPAVSGNVCAGCEIAMRIEFSRAMCALEDSGRGVV